MALLELPDARHEAQNAFDCGKTAVLCVLDYFDLSPNYAKRLEATPDGIPPGDLVDALTLAGLSVSIGQWTIGQIKRLGTPFIAFINDEEGVDHYCVIAGVSRGRVHYFDPSHGNVSKSVEEFMTQWHSVDKKNRPLVRWGIGVDK